jgi:hypothetical protein
MATTLAGRPKLILDQRVAGRRHLWLADPEHLNPLLNPLPDRALPPPELGD